MDTRKESDRKLSLTAIIWSLFNASDAAVTGTVYTCYIKPALTGVYKNTLRFVCLPILLVDSLLAAISYWYWVYLDRNANGSLKAGWIVGASVSTLAAIFMVGAAVFGMLAQFQTSILSPLFFALNMATNSIFNLFASVYYWGKSVAAPDPTLLNQQEIIKKGDIPDLRNRKKIYGDRAFGHFIAGLMGALVSVTAVVVVVFGKTIYAPIGVALGVFGVLQNTYMAFKKIRAHRQAWNSNNATQTTDAENKLKDPLSQNARMHQKLNALSRPLLASVNNDEGENNREFENAVEYFETPSFQPAASFRA